MSDTSKEEGEISNSELKQEAEILETIILGEENKGKDNNIPLTISKKVYLKPAPSSLAYDGKEGQL